MSKILLNKIKNNQELIGVIGMGYVGLPLAVSFAEIGINVIGFDISHSTVKNLNMGVSHIGDVKSSEISKILENKVFHASTDFSQISICDALIICVPTPLDEHLKPDMSYIKSAVNTISKYLTKNTFISLESTTYPTTTEELILPLLEEKSGLSNGKDFWLAYSPERVDPGNEIYNTQNTPKVVGAMDEKGLMIAEKLYQKAIKTIHKVSSPRSAEMVKILENTYRLVNISLINELALLSGKMGIDIWEVIDAAKTKPFGFQAFYPGPGIGGHCIPLDPFYLEFIAKKHNFDLSMIHSAGHINMRMPHYMYIKISTALNSVSKSVKGSNILIIGVAYKPEISDIRESTSIKIINTLIHKGGLVSYHDPYVKSITLRGKNKINSSMLTANIISKADAVVICTNHKIIDYDLIDVNSKIIVDLRNSSKRKENIFKL